MTDYVLATIKEWNLTHFAECRSSLPGNWHLFADPMDLTEKRIETINPRYLFLPHWSWKVPEEVFSKSETILFHMTDLPYGRGGSPLQNLIARGHKETMISAVRMEKTLDTGPVYMKRPLDLSGNAVDIYQRASSIIFDMIAEIVKTEPEPAPQQGEPTIFKRRTPEMSTLPISENLEVIYDHIRMLDAPGYPPAFIDNGKYRMTLSNAQYNDGILEARVHIFTRRGQDNG